MEFLNFGVLHDDNLLHKPIDFETTIKLHLIDNNDISSATKDNDKSVHLDLNPNSPIHQPKEKPKSCRLCLTIAENDPSSSFLNIFEEINLENTIANIVSQHFLFIEPIEKSDETSTKLICSTCWNIVNNFHNFYEKIRIAHYYLAHTENIYTAPIKCEDEIQIQHIDDLQEHDDDESSKLIGDHGDLPEMNTNEKKKRKIVVQSQVSPHTENIVYTAPIDIADKIEVEKNKNVQDNVDRSAKLVRGGHNWIPKKVVLSQKEKEYSLEIKMPKHFNDQDMTEDIFLRFSKIQPFIFDERQKKLLCNYNHCIETFKHRKVMMKHIKKHDPLPYICPEGDERFSTLQETLNHIKEIHVTVDSIVKCTSKILPKNFHDQDKTEDIVKRFRKIRPFILDDKEDIYHCNYCDFSNRHNNIMMTHIMKHDSLPYICPEGDERFQSFHEALDHIKKVHTTDSNSTVCSFCGKSNLTKEGLKIHIQSVHRPVDQPKVQCHECGNWLQDKRILKIHYRQQHGEEKEPKQCDICLIVLSSAIRLAYHKRKYHDKTKTYKKHTCSICSKEFFKGPRLKEHMTAVHGGGGEPFLYQCEYCQKSFNFRSNFYAHRKRMHSEEMKKIQDEIDADRTIQSGDNKTNGNDVEKIFKFSCTMCLKEFQFKKQLKEHFAAEHTEKTPTYQCEFCPEKFHKRLSFSSHFRLMHPCEFKTNLKNKGRKKQ